MNREIEIKGGTYTLKHFTVKQRIELNKLDRTEGNLEHAVKLLEYGTTLSREEILDLSGDIADELFIEVVEHNKPPLELLQRLQSSSTQTTTPT